MSVDRRHFLSLMGGTLAAMSSSGCTAASSKSVIVIGAGVAGLSAAKALAQAGQGPFNPSELLQRDVVRAWLGELSWREVLVARDGVVPDELLDAARLAAAHAPTSEERALAEAAVARLTGA